MHMQRTNFIAGHRTVNHARTLGVAALLATIAAIAAGATNAALLAAAILGNTHPQVRSALEAFRAAQTSKVLAQPDPRQPPVT